MLRKRLPMAELGPIREVALPAIDMAAVVADVPLAEMATGIKPLFGRFAEAMKAAGYVFWGPEMALYQMRGDVMHCVIGVELDAVPEGLERVSLPATRAFCQRWAISIGEFGAAHEAMHVYAYEKGFTEQPWAREIYRALDGQSGVFECDIIVDLAAETD